MACFDPRYQRLIRHSDEAIAKIELSLTARWNHMVQVYGREVPADLFMSAQTEELGRLWQARDLIFRCYKSP
jgi:hypothetical protein